MDRFDPNLALKCATTEADRLGAYRLRYDVFVSELGGDGALVDHDRRLEMDRFDPFFDQIILVDTRRDPATLDHVVGVYRVMRGEQAARAGQFYSEDEYDLGVLRESGRSLLELGRSCVAASHRNGAAMLQLWQGLADYVRDYRIDILFGVASFHGTDVASLAEPLSLLHHRHLAPPELRVRAVESAYQRMDLVPEADIDRPAAMRAIPTLIKSYLKLGGCVGDGAFIDYPFNTIDVCLVMDTARLSASAQGRYGAAG
ncbi:L-ornithine N(alpha)-acyltransferase [Ovoidimarina sediminis]|uniref:GNAT family N-acetyltransferase n=1 Tax=Ovoidimarina sediminis TaxID=3079856 RepID=UPI0029124DD4|nr:GNAT family N-acyltransferase [Rhodophyticola sp. MJ-SS7]MDU8944970.1 GNAT family N-acyltransferase [Rhodophyticola sp. MJ-SS7]